MTVPRPSTMTVLSIVLLVLVPALAALQYTWVGQLSEAERERMERSLRTSVEQFREAFNLEIARATLNLQIGPVTQRDGSSEQYSERYDGWVDASEHPTLVANIYFVDAPQNALRLRRWEPSTHQLVTTDWPMALAPYRDIFERERVAFVPERPFERRVRLVPHDAFIAIPLRRGVAIPQRVPGPVLRQSAVFGITLLEMNLEVIRDTMIPKLVKEHITPRGDVFRVAVIDTDENERLIYRSDAAAPVTPETADAEETFFGARFIAGFSEADLLVPLSPRAAAAAAPAPAVPPMLAQRRDRPPGRWRILVQHQSGSLDAAVGAIRRRNLALSFGALVLLAGSIVLLAEGTRRSQRLARQQIEFVAGVSHELRTPVSVITSAAENLSSGVVSGDRVKEYGRVIGVEGRRLGETVEQVLRYAAVDTRPDLTAATASAPAAIIAAAIDSTAVEGAGVTIERTTDADLPLVVGDQAALRAAVRNLVANAIKYGGADRWVGVRTSRQEQRGRAFVRIDVTDHGRGIPASELSHIFQPFYRGEDALARQIRGNGLGLSLVRRIVTAHGGEVSVASRPGHTTFTILLPGATAQQDILPRETESPART